MIPRQIIETGNTRMAVLDLESKLLQSRMLFITGPFDEESVSTWQAELLYLASKIKPEETEKKPIIMYINSPGGDAYSYLGLYGIMQQLIAKGYVISTRCIGLAASAGAYLLMAGSPGYRQILPEGTVLLHQPSSGTMGTVTDMEIDLKEGIRIKNVLNTIVKKHASEELIPMLERDAWLSPEDALKYKIVDKII